MINLNLMEPTKPILYLFPSMLAPVQASDVLPRRNIELLRQVKHFIVENVRTARRFIKACDSSICIDELTFCELNRHTDPASVPAMLAPMEQGLPVGVISEAGCPAVADPGADVVAIALRRGYEVMPLVGPSSIIMGVMASGFNGQSFAFNGYLPIDSAQRAARLREMERRIRRERQTQVFIETPYRNNKLVQWLSANMPGDLLLCVAADITGPAQNITTMPLSRWKSRKYDYDKTPAIFLLYS